MKDTLLEKTLYHSLLRISVCVMAVVLIFDSGILLSSTNKLSVSTQQYLANAVGVKVGVAPTELNTLTARITELEGELEKKDREIAVKLNTETSPANDESTFVLSVILFILLVLIVLNYALDYIRMRDMDYENQSLHPQN